MTCLNDDHRRILLIDQNRAKQNLRATILRNYEIEVHTANSITDAGALWARHFYDLVLLAAEENSEEATAVSARIRQINPRQRIGLLVGPPAFIRELGGTRREAGRRKAASVVRISPSPAASAPEPLYSPHASAPQWGEMIRKLVTDWYVDQNVVLGLAKWTHRIAGA
jgi:CheY-like chemotaxis protein